MRLLFISRAVQHGLGKSPAEPVFPGPRRDAEKTWGKAITDE